MWVWVWVLSGAAYLAQEVGRQVLVDGEVPFLLGQAGESDGGRRLWVVDISVYVSRAGRFQSSEKSLGQVIRMAQTYLWRGEGRSHSSTAGEPEHVGGWCVCACGHGVAPDGTGQGRQGEARLRL